MYPFHKQDNIKSLLKDFRIGDLHPEDILDEKDLPDFKEIQTQNLGRSEKLRVVQDFPFNAETDYEYLSDHFYTPIKRAFERNHNLIPQIDPEDYELLLHSKSATEPISLSLNEIKSMPKHTLVSYLACAGNKRKYLQTLFPNIKGLKWGPGAISNSVYKGVSIRYILLEKMGYTEDELKGKHLIAKGYDADFQGKHYEVSVPCEYALDPLNEVMLAYEINGEPLPWEHGFPLRMVVPGCIAVRSCKWVQ